MTDTRYAYYPVFSSLETGGQDPVALAHEVETLFKELDEKLTVRGIYSTAGFREDADLLMWWVTRSAEDVQDVLREFRHTELGKSMLLAYSFLGVARPPETAPDHVPAFLRGEPAKRYLCVYPFVRSPEWYLLPQQERGELLRVHGEMGREYPGVLANTTSAFGLNDWEWILAFEADDLPELVDCIRHLRGSESRRYVKEETPFITGVRKELVEAIRDFV
jgi:hydrogen peroxide-dependent heme synthase